MFSDAGTDYFEGPSCHVCGAMMVKNRDWDPKPVNYYKKTSTLQRKVDEVIEALDGNAYICMSCGATSGCQ